MATRSGIEAVRAANLGEVLRRVHHDGPTSRAELTAGTGLNRSTVADLVQALAEDGLVNEGEPNQTRRVGRPSPVVSASPDVVAIAVLPEVDALEIAAVGFGAELREYVRFGPVRTTQAVAEKVAEQLALWRAGALSAVRIVGLGVAVPGLVRSQDGLIRLAPHLGWEDEDLGTMLSARTGLSVSVGNDASLGARAEHLFGSAHDVADAVYLNGGASGIGGGIVLGGRLIGGADGYAGEWGQNRPSIAGGDRRTDHGVLEDEVSRSRLLEVLGIAVADDALLATSLAASDDPAVRAEVDRQRRILASTLANAINVLNPRRIVLGGFLAMLRERDAEEFERLVRESALDAPGSQSEVRSAQLGDKRILIGAAEAAFDTLLADPLA
ncbi:ROK family protein [Microbacterium amylolyticum]|uniref:NBD/HSP70 family sugar kinase n=1 Tax=Microbacterium amylolyticum TaxID=936337 RepID=A0ABS4ZK07_9MICO|nr:ROK family protein [Microbacterium amylolyticum]MBP2437623.1 putative NBD/HSP70 family sugar kinase [Microbacterium amylolyticum]